MQTTELPTDVTLTRSPLGGHAVYQGGNFIGWIKTSDDRAGWLNAYRKGNGSTGVHVGHFATTPQAVNAIIEAA